jgi:hypothetical protein
LAIISKKAKRPPPEWDDSPGVVLADDGGQIDSNISESGQRGLVLP